MGYKWVSVAWICLHDGKLILRQPSRFYDQRSFYNINIVTVNIGHSNLSKENENVENMQCLGNCTIRKKFPHQKSRLKKKKNNIDNNY